MAEAVVNEVWEYYLKYNEPQNFFSLECDLSHALSLKLNKVGGYLGLNISAKSEKALKNIIANFIVHDFEDLLVSFDSNFYDKGSKYNGTGAGYRAHDKLWKELELKGYIEVKKSSNMQVGLNRVRSTVVATELFKSKISEKLKEIQNPKEHITARRELVVLRKKIKGEYDQESSNQGRRYETFGYVDDKNSKNRRKFLENYNKFIKKFSIGVNAPAGYEYGSGEVRIIENAKYNTGLYSVFSTPTLKFDEANPIPLLCGRMYGGWWQMLSEGTRKFITINGKKTSELDFSSIAINQLYCIETAKPFTGDDAYNLELNLGFDKPDIVRSAIKVAAQIALNTTSRSEYVNALRHKFFEETKFHPLIKYCEGKGIDLPEAIIKVLLKTHSQIAKYFFNQKFNHKNLIDGVPISYNLQYSDSQIAKSVIQHFMGKGIPILPIHDSFIIEAEYEAELKEVMNNEFMKFFNGKGNIEGYDLVK